MADLGAIGAGGTVGGGGPISLDVFQSAAYLGTLNLGLTGAHVNPVQGPVRVVDYPSVLPRPTFSGYQLAPVDQTIRTDLDTGAPRQRRRTTVRYDQVSVQWFLNDTQMTEFRSWFENSSQAAGGAAWFAGLDLAVGTGGLTPVDCRFVGPWTANLIPGMYWEVSAKLEVRPYA